MTKEEFLKQNEPELQFLNEAEQKDYLKMLNDHYDKIPEIMEDFDWYRIHYKPMWISNNNGKITNEGYAY